MLLVSLLKTYLSPCRYRPFCVGMLLLKVFSVRGTVQIHPSILFTCSIECLLSFPDSAVCSDSMFFELI